MREYADSADKSQARKQIEEAKSVVNEAQEKLEAEAVRKGREEAQQQRIQRGRMVDAEITAKAQKKEKANQLRDLQSSDAFKSGSEELKKMADQLQKESDASRTAEVTAQVQRQKFDEHTQNARDAKKIRELQEIARGDPSEEAQKSLDKKTEEVNQKKQARERFRKLRRERADSAVDSSKKKAEEAKINLEAAQNELAKKSSPDAFDFERLDKLKGDVDAATRKQANAEQARNALKTAEKSTREPAASPQGLFDNVVGAFHGAMRGDGAGQEMTSQQRQEAQRQELFNKVPMLKAQDDQANAEARRQQAEAAHGAAKQLTKGAGRGAELYKSGHRKRRICGRESEGPQEGFGRGYASAKRCGQE